MLQKDIGELWFSNANHNQMRKEGTHIGIRHFHHWDGINNRCQSKEYVGEVEVHDSELEESGGALNIGTLQLIRLTHKARKEKRHRSQKGMGWTTRERIYRELISFKSTFK